MATRAWRDKFGRDDDWKKSEDDVIKKYYKNNTDKQIAKALGRTEDAVQHRRLSLKIKKPRLIRDSGLQKKQKF